MQAEPMQLKSSRIARLVHNGVDALAKTKILIVGVGGIGCQVLKVLSKSQVGQIHILDMDTIQLSNLNRQFLFKAQHKGKSKALVARQSVLNLNPRLNIEAHHKNIKELPIAFFKQFGFIVMALDNIEARNYVNKIGVRLGIPIVDAGTLAYKGNVTTIISQISRCYSCQPKSSSQKVYPVCTIRMRPEKPIHCIVWAKMLFQVIFGATADGDMSDMQVLRDTPEIDVLKQLFHQEIENLRNSKTQNDNKLNEIFLKSVKSIPYQILEGNVGQLRQRQFQNHDKVQQLEVSVSAFGEGMRRLRRQRQRLGSVVFEKDDDDIILFISAAANLRMFCFGIQQQSFNEVKNMAGNIIPAIASTNSIVSGIEVLEMLKQIRGIPQKMRSYFIQNQSSKILALKLQKPLPECGVCGVQAIPVTLQCNFNKFTIKDLVQFISKSCPTLEEYSINLGSRQIYNSEEPREALLEKSILQIGESVQFDLILTDQDSSTNVCLIWMVHNEQTQDLTASNIDKFSPKPKIQEKSAQIRNGNDQDSDIVVFGDEISPQLQIVGVYKRQRQQDDPDLIQPPQKKKKLQ